MTDNDAFGGGTQVVTGGAGFIGSHLVEALLAQGHRVVVLDDLSTGQLSNLDRVSSNPRLEIVIGSVTNPDDVRRAMAEATRVYHLAAAVGVGVIVGSPLNSLRTNIHGTEVVLDEALRRKAHVLLASTSEVYGKNTSDALHETSDRILGSPLISRWGYAAAKGIDEAFAHAYWRELGLPVTIIRLFNTVGPRQVGHYGMVVPRLVGQALKGDQLTVHGDGQQTRCFSYVLDVVPSIIALATEPRSHGQAFNLGGAEEVSIGDLARRVIATTRSSSSVELVPYEQAYPEGFEDMRRRVPDNSSANAMVGYVPTTTLEEMIAAIAAYLTDREAASATPSTSASFA